MHNFGGIVLEQCWFKMGKVHGEKVYTSQILNFYGFIVLALCFVNKLKNKFIITCFQQLCKIKHISQHSASRIKKTTNSS